VIRAFIFSLMATLIWADESVNVTVDRRDIIEGESIILTVTANNVKSYPEVRLPEMPDFKVVSGSNKFSSKNIQLNNSGKRTQNSTITLSWSLIPKRTGQLTIPALKIQVGKKPYLLPPITVSVSKRGSSQSGKVSQYFIEAKVDNQTPYRGEQTTLTYTLYTKVVPTSFDGDEPNFKGFWTEELFAPKKIKIERREEDLKTPIK